MGVTSRGKGRDKERRDQTKQIEKQCSTYSPFVYCPFDFSLFYKTAVRYLVDVGISFIVLVPWRTIVLAWLLSSSREMTSSSMSPSRPCSVERAFANLRSSPLRERFRFRAAGSTSDTAMAEATGGVDLPATLMRMLFSSLVMSSSAEWIALFCIFSPSS